MEENQSPKQEKASKLKKVLAAMSASEKKTVLLIFFIGITVMLIINILKVIIK
jgi:cell division protein FtsL